MTPEQAAEVVAERYYRAAVETAGDAFGLAAAPALERLEHASADAHGDAGAIAAAKAAYFDETFSEAAIYEMAVAQADRFYRSVLADVAYALDGPAVE